jgi:hypothetical protein
MAALHPIWPANEKPRKLALPGQVPGSDDARWEEAYQPAKTWPLKRSATKAFTSGV